VGIVVLVPVPEVAVPPGNLVKIQVPEAGKSFSITLPVAIVQVGWIIVVTVGTAGVDGCALMNTLADTGDVHPDTLVTV
jgi:hypothetical protein